MILFNLFADRCKYEVVFWDFFAWFFSLDAPCSIYPLRIYVDIFYILCDTCVFYSNLFQKVYLLHLHVWHITFYMVYTMRFYIYIYIGGIRWHYFIIKKYMETGERENIGFFIIITESLCIKENYYDKNCINRNVEINTFMYVDKLKYTGKKSILISNIYDYTRYISQIFVEPKN